MPDLVQCFFHRAEAAGAAVPRRSVDEHHKPLTNVPLIFDNGGLDHRVIILAHLHWLQYQHLVFAPLCAISLSGRSKIVTTHAGGSYLSPGSEAVATTRKVTVVPSPGLEATRKSPPSSLARFRMLGSPLPPLPTDICSGFASTTTSMSNPL